VLKYFRSSQRRLFQSLRSCLCFLLLFTLFASLLSSPCPANATLSDAPVSWSNFNFIPATYNSAIISDYESSGDPSRGTAAVNPANTDISSCSPDGYLPGNEPSFLYGYYDAGTSLDTSDDYLALRMRLNGTPLENREVGLDSGHWYILIDIDNDGWKEFAIDIDGTVNSNRPDRVYLLYNDLPTNNVTPRSGAQRSNSDVLGADEINLWYAAGPAATGVAQTNNHVRVLTANPSCSGGSEFWLDVQMPVSAFKVGGVQKLDNATPARFFISTSASAVDPLQKDWILKMLSDPIFSDPWEPSVYASKTATLLEDNDTNGTASPGDVLRYDITITNSGLLNMLNVVFYDAINDPNLLLVDHSVVTTGNVDKDTGNEVEVSFASIASGGSVTISFHVTILLPSIPGVNVVSNQGLVSGSNFTSILTDDPTTPTPNDATRTTLTIPPTLRITKEGPAEANAGSNITFTGTLTNYGTAAAENVTLVDYLPDGLTFVSSSHGATYNPPPANTVTWNLGTLNGGASISGWVTVHVSDNVTNNTTLSNLFSVTWKDGSGQSYGPATATKDIIVRTSPLLSIVKNGPATGIRGSLLTYTGTLTNYGTAAAENVTLVDYLPDGLTFVSSSHGATYNPPPASTVTWNLGTLNGGASMSGWVTVRVDDTVPNGTTLTDTFSVTWEDADGNPYGPAASSVDTIIYTAPQLTITKEGPHEATVGSYVTFTGTLTNVGGSPADNVTLVDYLPPGLTFIGSSHTAVYNPAARTVTWYLGTVGTGVSIPGWLEVHVDGSLPDGTDLLNTFSVTWQDGIGTIYGPATATADVIARTNPLLTISKSGPAQGSPGGTLTFTMNITNSGGFSAYNVTLVDVLPDVYTYISSSPAGAVSVGNVIWNLGTLAPGGSTPVSLTVRVDNDVANATTLINGVLATWEDEQGNSYGPASNGLATTIYTVPNLEITKTGPDIANPGDNCTYNITLTNTSATAADNVTLVDYIPTDMSYVSSSDGGTHAGGIVTWNLGTIAGGASRTVSVILRVDPTLDTEEVLTDIAVVTWKDNLNNDYGPHSDSAQTRICPFPMLSLDISGPATGEPCDTLTFAIRVTNTSANIRADNVILQYILPSGSAYVSSSNGGNYLAGIVVWNLGALATAGSREVTVTITYCVIPVGSEIISTAGAAWQCPAGITRGPVFDTSRTRIIAPPEPPPPPPPPPPEPPQPAFTPPPKPRPSPHPPTTQSSWSEPPSMTFSNLTIENYGPQQTICIVIRSSGGPGGYTAVLKINGAVESRTPVSLSRGATRQICWTVYKSEPGNYLVEVGGQKAWFTVSDDAGTTAVVYVIFGLFASIILGLIIIILRLS